MSQDSLFILFKKIEFWIFATYLAFFSIFKELYAIFFIKWAAKLLLVF